MCTAKDRNLVTNQLKDFELCIVSQYAERNRGMQNKTEELCFALFYSALIEQWKLTVFISWKVFINLPSQDWRESLAIDSMSETMLLIASGTKARRTSFLNLKW